MKDKEVRAKQEPSLHSKGISFTLKLIFGVKVPILPAADTLPSTSFLVQILVFGVKVPILPAAKNPSFNLFLLSKPCLWCQSAYFACC